MTRASAPDRWTFRSTAETFRVTPNTTGSGVSVSTNKHSRKEKKHWPLKGQTMASYWSTPCADASLIFRTQLIANLISRQLIDRAEFVISAHSGGGSVVCFAAGDWSLTGINLTVTRRLATPRVRFDALWRPRGDAGTGPSVGYCSRKGRSGRRTNEP